MRKIGDAARFLGWLALLQVLAVAVGLDVIFLFLDFFDDGAEFFVYGWVMLPLWFLWGLLTPKAVRPGGKVAAWLLLLWTALLAALVLLLPDYRMLLATPQLAAGGALARLWPGSHHGALFLWTVEPIAQGFAHAMLPALLGLGLWLSGRRKE